MSELKTIIDANIKENGNQEITGKTLNYVLNEIAKEVYQGGNFNAEGNYPLLHVGTADDLAGRGESVPAEFGFRASGGKSIKDGRAYIKKIKGNSVVWNQWVDTIATQDCDLSETDNRLTLTPQGDFPGVENAIILNIVENHVYICISHRIGGGFLNVNCGGQDVATNVPFRAGHGHYGFVVYSYNETQPFTITRPILIDLTKMFQAGNEPTTIEEFNARVATLGIDMYAYNEGQVIHCNTESIKSVGDNAWDEQWEEGALDHSNGAESISSTRIRSKNFCRIIGGEEYYLVGNNYNIVLYDENYQWLDYWGAIGEQRKVSIDNRARWFKVSFNASYGTTYKNDMLISLYHSGWKAEKDDQYQPYWQDTLPLPIIRKYFPDGMMKAGAAHDEIRYNKASGKWEYSKGKIKSVDLGDLDWNYYPAADGYPFGFFYASPQGRKYGEKNILCGKYAFGDFANDKSILGNTNGENIYIMDSAYTDAASFKAAMQGVMLYYESNDWEWVELDAEDQNFRNYYQVADFGTEQSQSLVPSAPFSADIIYQFNAVDMIREHELEITELQSIIATMQAQLASLANI